MSDVLELGVIFSEEIFPEERDELVSLQHEVSCTLQVIFNEISFRLGFS